MIPMVIYFNNVNIFYHVMQFLTYRLLTLVVWKVLQGTGRREKVKV